MIELLIGLIVLIGAGFYGIKTSYDYSFHEFASGMIAIIGCLGLLVYCTMVFDYFAAGYKAHIINREYNTNYTQLEVFYASDVIDTVRDLNRKRVELNGNLITGKQKCKN
jgi:hypothetical protein